MGRPVVLSNGQLFVGLDENGLVHDFYYPYVGLENLTNARNSQHKIGVWVDGNFHWVDDGSWEISVDFETDALISKIKMHSPKLAVTLTTSDFIDPDTNALIRCLNLTNELDQERDVRLFMHQVFQISRAGRADTAMYVPDEHYLLDYKGRYCLLIAGRTAMGEAFDQFAVGGYGIEGKAGTFKDAEDGVLSGNPVEHGGVDSVIRFQTSLKGHQTWDVDYWIIAASSQSEVERIHTEFKAGILHDRQDAAREYWHQWLEPAREQLKLVPEKYRKEVQKSILIIKAHCDERGSVLASGDSSIFNYGRDYYCYCWPRDAAYALWPLIRLGLFDEAKAYLEFARDTMHRDGYLMHKYQPDRAIGSTWHPLLHSGQRKELAIQEDETASVLFMIGEYYNASQDHTFVENLYHTFVAPSADFLVNFVDKQTGLPHASYDLWEEKFLTTTYSVCTVIAALATASRLAKALERPDDAVRWKRAADSFKEKLDLLYRPAGYFCKGYMVHLNGDMEYDDTLDISSLYGPFMYAGLELDDERLVSTAKHVEEKLLNSTPIGGVIRNDNDHYFRTKGQYKGNPWIVCTLWLAQYYQANKQYDKAEKLIQWSLDRAYPSGALSEQFDPETGLGVSVTPLVWSHAEFVNTTLDTFVEEKDEPSA